MVAVKIRDFFKHIVEELKVAPSKILHIGDNYNSDVLSASKEGIATIFYSKFDKKFDEAFDREWPKDPSQRHLLLDSDQGDFGISALRSKIYHHIALKEIEKKDRFFWQYGAMVLGPILWGFVHWIYDRCYEMKEHQVFCLMREGNLYAKLIDRFAPYYPKHTLKAHRLWVSRRFYPPCCHHLC